MAIILGLVLFWTGLIVLILSITGKILIAPWIVAVIWVVALAIYIVCYVIGFKLAEDREKQNSNDHVEDLY